MSAFATTRWTLIARAQGDTVEARAALAELCRAYWQPIYAFIRRTHDADAALDLTQGFFVLLFERGLLRRIDLSRGPSRGRFRSFLLVALKHHLSDERDRAEAQKRGGQLAILSLDADGVEERYASGRFDSETPERAYERAWAQTVLERAMDRLRSEHVSAGRSDRFEALRGVLTDSSLASYAGIGERLGMTGGAVKVAVHRLRQRYRELLAMEVADTVAADGDVEAELRELLFALARGGG